MGRVTAREQDLQIECITLRVRESGDPGGQFGLHFNGTPGQQYAPSFRARRGEGIEPSKPRMTPGPAGFEVGHLQNLYECLRAFECF
jgi:hypothetical protein